MNVQSTGSRAHIEPSIFQGVKSFWDEVMFYYQAKWVKSVTKDEKNWKDSGGIRCQMSIMALEAIAGTWAITTKSPVLRYFFIVGCFFVIWG